MASSSEASPETTIEERRAELVVTRKGLDSFHEDVQYLWSSSSIPVYEKPPSALLFLRNHVAVSRPCIIRNAISSSERSGPLLLTLEDLLEQFSDDSFLTVDVTPDGHGDCLRSVKMEDDSDRVEKVFVRPMEQPMKMRDFCRNLRKGRLKQSGIERPESKHRVFASVSNSNPKSVEKDEELWENSVLYYSRQNDCLRQELSSLWNMKKLSSGDGDSFVFPRSFPWAEEAFFGQTGTGPDAVNLWMGDDRAVSAMHKDHYENLFYVLSGEKVFGLCPPSDAPFLYERKVPSGRFEPSNRKDQQWSVGLDGKDSEVHWIATDLFGEDDKGQVEDFPLSKYAHPITVKVREGELLYLPSLWFHRVTQTCETIGINYWYDMNFESPLWCYFHFLQQLRSSERP